MFAIASAPDPYLFGEVFNSNYSGAGYRATVGRTLRTPALNSGEKTSVLVCAGQSNICNSTDTLFTPTNAAKIDNLNVYDGGVYAAVDMLLGCQTIPNGNGNHMLRTADKLITAGVTSRVILVPVGVGGTKISEWQSTLFQRIIAGLKRCAAVNLPVSAICWHQGESDMTNGTTQAAYAAGLSAVISAVGATAPWFVSQASWDVGSTSAAVLAAQASLVNGTTIFAGPNTDTITATGRQADNTHFNASGADTAASLWVAKLAGKI